jgi:segregation and condensation protein B
MDQRLINRIVEAALLATSHPMPIHQLYGLFPEEEPAPEGSIETALEFLREGCAERGVELVEVASGYRFQVKQEVHGWVSRMWTERKTKYTRATLETLALIAYRQPITRGEIEQVRGVAVSSNIIQALEEREWIRVVGHRDVPGRPALFGTTKGFLDYFGLKSLDALPPLSELRDIGELEPQLMLGEAPLPAAGAAASDADVPVASDGSQGTPAQDTDQAASPDLDPTLAHDHSDEAQPGTVEDPQDTAVPQDPPEAPAAPQDIPEDDTVHTPADSDPETQEDDANVVSSEQKS